MSLSNAVRDVLALKNLAPSPKVNRVMSELVTAIINDTEVKQYTAISPLNQHAIRTTSAAAETEMETFWAKLIIDSQTPHQALATFPYTENYAELTSRELDLVAESGLTITSEHTALIIGSGPLPLTSFEIIKQTGAHVDNVDASIDAIQLSRKLAITLENKRTDFLHATGEEVSLSRHYDLILIAALAGETAKDKQRIISNILPSLKSGGRIIVRSAKDSRTLLYPAIQANDITSLKLLKEYHPNDHIINSVFVYERES